MSDLDPELQQLCERISMELFLIPVPERVAILAREILAARLLGAAVAANQTPLAVLASQLPKGQAEKVLQEAVEQHHAVPEYFPCGSCAGTGQVAILGELSDCEACGGAGDVTRYVFRGVP